MNKDELINTLEIAKAEAEWNYPLDCTIGETDITWVNRSPTRYYADIKGKPFTATAVYYHGRWYWWTAIIRSVLEDCEKAAADWEIDDCIDVTAWMPLPEPMKEGD